MYGRILKIIILKYLWIYVDIRAKEKLYGITRNKRNNV